MAFGFRLYGASGQAQIDSDFINVRLMMQGSVTAYDGISGYYEDRIQMPFDVRDECPLVLLRPGGYGQYVGGLIIDPPHGGFGSRPPSVNGEVRMIGQQPFEYAIFSTKGVPIRDSGRYGLRVRRPDGSIAYTSQDRHPRIVTLNRKDPDPWGWPVTYLTGSPGVPWFLGNALIETGLGVGEFSESTGAVMACANNNGSYTVQLRDGALNQDFPAIPNRTAYNPYRETPAYFGVVEFA